MPEYKKSFRNRQIGMIRFNAVQIVRPSRVKIVAEACAAVTLLAFAWMCLSVGVAVRRIALQAEATLADVRRLTLSAGGVTADVRKIAESFKKQSDAQAKALTDTTRALTQTTRALNSDLTRLGLAITDIDHEMHVHSANLTVIESDVQDTLQDARSLIQHTQPAMDAATETLKNTATITGDPAIEDSLESIRMGTASIGLTAAHLEATSKDIQVAVHRETRPLNWWAHVGELILDEGAKVATWTYGFFKK